MSLLKTPWFILVELPVPATATQVANFPDQPDLTTLTDQVIKILAIEVFTSDVIAVCPSGNNNAPIAELQKAMLFLQDDNQQRVVDFPLLSLNRTFTPAAAGTMPSVWDLQLFDRLQKIAWTKSGVDFSTAPAGAPYSFLFGIHYDKLQAETIKSY